MLDTTFLILSARQDTVKTTNCSVLIVVYNQCSDEIKYYARLPVSVEVADPVCNCMVHYTISIFRNSNSG